MGCQTPVVWVAASMWWGVVSPGDHARRTRALAWWARGELLGELAGAEWAGAVNLVGVLAADGAAADWELRAEVVDHKFFAGEPVVALGAAGVEIARAIYEKHFRGEARAKVFQAAFGFQFFAGAFEFGEEQAVELLGENILGVLDAEGEALPFPAVAVAREVRQQLEVGAEMSGEVFGAPLGEVLAEALGGEMDGRQMVGAGVGGGVGEDDVLVVGLAADGGFVGLELFDAKVVTEFQFARVRPPRVVVAGGLENVAHQFAALSQKFLARHMGGHAAIDEDVIGVDGHLDAHECLGARGGGGGDDGLGDGVGKAVGVSGRNVFGEVMCFHFVNPSWGVPRGVWRRAPVRGKCRGR